MSDKVKLIIEIPSNDYEYLKNNCIIPIKYDNHIYEAILNGTLLPKGHGRLIDADALYDSTKLCHTEEDGTACVEWREINDAPTIIEADEESEEE